MGIARPAHGTGTGDISSVEERLRSIDEAYHRNHRGGGIGHYRFIDRGLIRAVAREHSPVESFVFVEERGDDCRRYGADTCTYTVHW